MVYTEYFVRGTEPVDMCPLHGDGMPNVIATSGDAHDGGGAAGRWASRHRGADWPAAPVDLGFGR